uniref:Uncharacterized protein n=1 Tax=Anguilla anguilla TaxID=7936 RepID=A0A0E9RZE3_ANGAN
MQYAVDELMYWTDPNSVLLTTAIKRI